MMNQLKKQLFLILILIGVSAIYQENKHKKNWSFMLQI